MFQLRTRITELSSRYRICQENMERVLNTYKNTLRASLAGRIYELLTTENINRELGKRRELWEYKCETTESMGLPHDPADIIITNSTDDVIDKIQTKAEKSKSGVTNPHNGITSKKYIGMVLLVPKEMLEAIKKFMQKASEREGNIFSGAYAEALQRLSDRYRNPELGIESRPVKQKDANNIAAGFQTDEKQPTNLWDNITAVFPDFIIATVGSAISTLVEFPRRLLLNKESKKDITTDMAKEISKSTAMEAAYIGGEIAAVRYLGAFGEVVVPTAVIAVSTVEKGLGINNLISEYTMDEIDLQQFTEDIALTTVEAATAIVTTVVTKGNYKIGLMVARVAHKVATELQKFKHYEKNELVDRITYRNSGRTVTERCRARFQSRINGIIHGNLSDGIIQYQVTKKGGYKMVIDPYGNIKIGGGY